jgi:hypothetical protein
MKKLLVSIIILVGLTATSVAQKNAGNWRLIITSKTTKVYLDSVSTAWASHNIVLKFTELKFNTKGTKLLQVSGTIDYTTADGQHMTSQISAEKIKKAIEIKINDKPSISVDSK